MKKKRTRPFNPPRISHDIEVLLETKALRTWVANLDGCLKFLVGLKKLPKGLEEPWARGNRTYYLDRVRKLVDNPPKGATQVAVKAKRLLDSLEN